MKIWKLDFAWDVYQDFFANPRFVYDEFSTFDGRSKLADWQPRGIKKAISKDFETKEKLDLPLGDMAGLDCARLMLSPNAVEVLSPLISPYAEFLPMKGRVYKFSILNVTTVLADAVDYEKSVFKRYPNGGRIMLFQKYAFRPQAIENIPIFKISDEPRRGAFVSEKFKQTVEDAHLTGFRFEPVWEG